jgi:translation initiation factor 2B subunit (eIF-2B alpha/beta/delta family)
LGSELISKKRHETIMIIGSNNVVEQTLMRAAKSDKDKERASFSVIVVDTCPSFSGREVA